jgi:hypothetical protein
MEAYNDRRGGYVCNGGHQLFERVGLDSCKELPHADLDSGLLDYPKEWNSHITILYRTPSRSLPSVIWLQTQLQEVHEGRV